MKDVKIFEDKTELAEAAAKKAVKILSGAIDEYGQAAWVLAGGSTPQLAYKIIASNHSDALNWSKVTLVMGDERIGPTDSPDNNWRAINEIIGKLPTKKLIPKSDKTAEEAAADYESQIAQLPKADNGLPRLDLVWLGVGPDGHTLSLFPSHTGLLPSGGLVSPIHGSPKPPRERISLSLRALTGVRQAMIIATGKDKYQAVHDATHGGSSPIALASSIIQTHEGIVTWYVDHDAISKD